MTGGRAPTPRDEPDQAKAQDGPEGWQTRGGRSSGHLGRPECWSQQTTARPRSGSAAAPKFTTSRTVQHISDESGRKEISARGPCTIRLYELIPTRADHHALDALAQSRRPMDMMSQGWSMSLFQA